MTEEKNEQYLQVLRIFRSLTNEELHEFICELNVDEKRLEPVIRNVYGYLEMLQSVMDELKHEWKEG